MAYKLQKQALNGPMFAFKSFRSAIGDKSLWPRLRKYQLSLEFPSGDYCCSICQQHFEESRKIELHEYYSASYDVASGHFSVSVVDLKFLCKDCHLVHHQSYVDINFTDEDIDKQNQHIAKVNNIPLSEAENMPILPVPTIEIINGNPNDNFYKDYISTVTSYSFNLGIDIADPDLKGKILERLSEVHLIQQPFFSFPILCFPENKRKRTKSSHLANTKFMHSRRKHLGLSQTEVASKCDVTVKTYRNWENGKVVPSEESFDKLGIALNVPKKYLKSKEVNSSHQS